MRVKICGLMRSADVATASKFGADGFGFVVASPTSRRNLSMTKARNLMKTVSVFSTKVAVTSSRDVRVLERICASLHPDMLQLHRAEQDTVRDLRKRCPNVGLILAARVRDRQSISEARLAARYSEAVLADSLGADGMGGTGRTHDWNLTARIRESIFPHPLILAGGLTPSNVRAAIRKVRPHAVDVSTGVEARVGVKDLIKVRDFIHNAKER